MAPPPEVDFDVEKLLAKGGSILQREITNLLSESAKGKLAAASARDLVSYIKLLHELRKADADAAADMTDEQLAAALVVK